jgi:glycosyltransferase involved in cell wall biosynthesis
VISVIIPARDEEVFIAAALHSVLAQSQDVGVEAIVIDDGSTDGTVGVVEDFIRGGAPIRLIRTTPQGVSAARNAGLAALSPQTDLVTFLDADDMFPKGRLARALVHFADDPDLAVVYGRMRLVETDEPDMEPMLSEADKIKLGIQMSAGLYRREVLTMVGAFDTTYELSEDFDFLLRLFERKPATKIVDDVGFYYRQHAGNTIKRTAELQRSFMRAALAHAKRRAVDSSLHAVDWMWAKDKVTR